MTRQEANRSKFDAKWEIWVALINLIPPILAIIWALINKSRVDKDTVLVHRNSQRATNSA